MWGQNVNLPNTNHPNKEHNDDDEDDCSSDTTSNVCKLWFFLAVFACETANTAARRLSSRVFHTGTLIVTVAHTYICEQWILDHIWHTPKKLSCWTYILIHNLYLCTLSQCHCSLVYIHIWSHLSQESTSNKHWDHSVCLVHLFHMDCCTLICLSVTEGQNEPYRSFRLPECAGAEIP
jgi:hypothetical protein